MKEILSNSLRLDSDTGIALVGDLLHSPVPAEASLFRPDGVATDPAIPAA
jgi:hypothetical protein